MIPIVVVLNTVDVDGGNMVINGVASGPNGIQFGGSVTLPITADAAAIVAAINGFVADFVLATFGTPADQLYIRIMGGVLQ